MVRNLILLLLWPCTITFSHFNIQSISKVELLPAVQQVQLEAISTQPHQSQILSSEVPIRFEPQQSYYPVIKPSIRPARMYYPIMQSTPNVVKLPMKTSAPLVTTVKAEPMSLTSPLLQPTAQAYFAELFDQGSIDMPESLDTVPVLAEDKRCSSYEERICGVLWIG